MTSKFENMSYDERKYWIQYEFATKAGMSSEALDKLAEWWKTIEKDGLQTLRKSDRTADEKMLLTLGIGIEMGRIISQEIYLEARP